MVESDHDRWERKYRAGSHAGSGRPSPFLEEHLALVGPPRGPALDVASGEGRHSLFLARTGWTVVALDISLTALERLHALARTDEEIRASGGRVACLQADALQWPTLPARLALIVCSRYLERDLVPQMTEALACGGTLFFETFTRRQLGEPTGPRNPAHLLMEGELPRLFPALTVVASREGRTAGGEWLSSLIARSDSRK